MEKIRNDNNLFNEDERIIMEFMAQEYYFDSWKSRSSYKKE